MSIEEKLKDLIKEKYKSIRAFTQKLSIPYSTIDNMLKRGIGGTGLSTLIPICNELNIDIDSLSRGKIEPKKEKIQLYITASESEQIKKYRALDEHGKKMVDFTLNEEYYRCTTPEETEEETPTLRIKRSTYKVSAGKGFPLDEGDSWDYIDVPDTPEARKADFALTISGDSMEPIYHDGDIILVKSQPNLEKGQIGIFILDNSTGYIKKNGGDRLISLNEKYDDIILNEDSDARVVGKVIGRV